MVVAPIKLPSQILMNDKVRQSEPETEAQAKVYLGVCLWLFFKSDLSFWCNKKPWRGLDPFIKLLCAHCKIVLERPGLLRGKAQNEGFLVAIPKGICVFDNFGINDCALKATLALLL